MMISQKYSRGQAEPGTEQQLRERNPHESFWGLRCAALSLSVSSRSLAVRYSVSDALALCAYRPWWSITPPGTSIVATAIGAAW